MERGDGAIGGKDEFDELMKELYTDEEIAEFEFKAALLGLYRKTHKEEKINMDKFEELSRRVYEEFKKSELVEA